MTPAYTIANGDAVQIDVESGDGSPWQLASASASVVSQSGATVVAADPAVADVTDPADPSAATKRLRYTLSGLANGLYAVTLTADDGQGKTPRGTVYVQVSGTGQYPALPAHMASLLAVRTKLRTVVQDRATPDPLDPAQSLPTVFSDPDLDDAIREALRVYSVYRQWEKPLPPLALQPGVAAYPMPFDFLAPETKSWAALLRDGWATGAFWGSRYGWMRYQQELAAPFPARSNGAGGYGLGFFPWGGGLTATGLAPVAYDGDGQIEAFTLPGFGRGGASFQEADLNNPTPVFALGAAPNAAQVYHSLRYYAHHAILRLSSADGATWDLNGDGSFVVTPTYDGMDAVDATDVLSVPLVGRQADAVRLVLLYAKYWVLSELVLARATDDAVQYAFYSQKTGQARQDIQKQAAAALAEFEKRTRYAAYGITG